MLLPNSEKFSSRRREHVSLVITSFPSARPRIPHRVVAFLVASFVFNLMDHPPTSTTTIATTIRHGTVVTADGAIRADIAISAAGKIAAIAPSLPPGPEDIDATGLYVLPGGVDSHCHIEQKTSTGLTPVDDFYTASVAALAGGTTTIIPFACQHRGARVRDVVAAYRALASKAACDYAVHIIVADPAEPHAIDDLKACFADGYSSVKVGSRTFLTLPPLPLTTAPSSHHRTFLTQVYMTYDALKLKDDELLDVLSLCRAHGAMVMVHAESHELIGWITRRLLSAEYISAKYHAVARPVIAEREAAHRAITFAELINTPLLIVHVSSAAAADEISRARNERNLPIYGETCPQYLYLTQSCLCQPANEGNKFLCSPPLRTERDQIALWSALSNGNLQVLSSDHSAYHFGGGGAASKTAGGPSTPFSKVPMGLPGLECRMPLLISGALAGRLNADACLPCGGASQQQQEGGSAAPPPPPAGTGGEEARSQLEGLVKAVTIACTMPAKLYGLYPRKGTLAVGLDADIALWDCSAAAERIITKGSLHDDLDYTPYEGMVVKGMVVRTLLRGRTVFQAGSSKAVEQLATRGGGAFLPTGKPSLPGWRGEAAWRDAGDVVEQRCVATWGDDHAGGGKRKRES